MGVFTNTQDTQIVLYIAQPTAVDWTGNLMQMFVNDWTDENCVFVLTAHINQTHFQNAAVTVSDFGSFLNADCWWMT